MKRIHIGLSVKDLDQSVAFYSALLGEDPLVLEKDYAKWAPKDPPVNLSVTASCCGEAPGGVHFGIDAETREDLGEVTDRLDSKGIETLDEGETICCYHRSTKSWAIDPDAFRWEVFLTSARNADYGHDFEALDEAHKRAQDQARAT